MLEQLLIFTRGGLILWTCKELGNALKGSPIDTLIRSCLLEEQSGLASYNYDASGASYSLKWTFHNELGIVFVTVYQKILHLLYVDDLLSMVKCEFSAVYDPCRTDYSDFDDVCRQLRLEAEARAEEVKKSSKQGARNVGKKQDQVQKKYDQSGKRNGGGDLKCDGGDGDIGKGNMLENGHVNGGSFFEEVYPKGSVNQKENLGSDNGAFDVNKLKHIRSKGVKKNDTGVATKGSKAEPNKKATKKNRVWGEPTPQIKL